ncbi:YfhO family protein [Trueperella bonasi]|nr:YfhO family protein [Trueperella bonasi]
MNRLENESALELCGAEQRQGKNSMNQVHTLDALASKRDLRFHPVTLFFTSFLATFALHLFVRWRSNVVPFLGKSGAIGDFATQYLPFYSRFREVIVDGNMSGFTFSWDLGLGLPALPDYATYLGGPWTFLIALFPQNQILLGMTIIIILRASLAAGVMRLLIMRLRRGLTGAIPLALSVSYGASSWIFEQGYVSLQWLDVLYGVPLLFLAVLEMRKPHPRWIWAGLAVGLVWWSNYYVAYMASLVAGLFCIVLAIGIDKPRQAVRNVSRFVFVGLLGVLLTAPTFIPVLRSLSMGVGLESPESLTPPPLGDVARRFLPFTYDIYATPIVYVGILAILLACAFLLTRDLSLRFKMAWLGGSIFLLLSLVMKPLLLVWNIFQFPHGSAYRWTFVVTAWLVVTAALAVESKGGPAIGGKDRLETKGISVAKIGAVLAGVLLIVLVVGKPTVSEHLQQGYAGRIVLYSGIIAAALIVVHMCAQRFGTPAKLGRASASALILVTTVAEIGGTGVFAAHNFRNGFFREAPFSSASEAQIYQHVAREVSQSWPQHRYGKRIVDDEKWWLSDNMSARYHYPGTDYYSTTATSEYVDAVTGIGFLHGSGGRFTYMPHDSLVAGIVAAAGVGELPVYPMVRVQADSANPEEGTVPSIYERRAALANAPAVYNFPDIDLEGERISEPVKVEEGQTYEIITHCKPRTIVFAAPVNYSVTPSADLPVSMSALEGVEKSTIGILGESGRALDDSQRFGMTLGESQVLGETLHVGCLDIDALQAAYESLTVPADLDISPGRVSASFDSPTSGRLVVATPAVEGWQCDADGHRSDIDPLSGFLSTKITDATSIDCTFEQPGLRVGVLLGLASLGALSALTWHSRIRIKDTHEA